MKKDAQKTVVVKTAVPRPMVAKVAAATKTVKPTTPAKKSFWTPKKVQSLVSWFEKLQGKEDVYSKVATKVGTTKAAAYKKLGRIGKIDAPWTKKASR